ncbi:MAG: flagellar export chaperone FlgN [Roseburia sp.]|nr:flagellar export chaperone FlgN [Roseburia sp.]MCM1278430.1 flagellar export chaperone FlgN [Robinsoniella sp.]
MTDNYIQIMIESLEKKEEMLDKIIEKNNEQAEILKEEKFSVELFDSNVEEKAVLIQQLELLDAGFDRMYEHVKEELTSQEGKAAYKNEIKKMQQLISNLTEKSVSIQAQESRNKQMVEKVFKGERERIKAVKLGSKAAIDYYRNMNHTNFVSPQFVDKKN